MRFMRPDPSLVVSAKAGAHFSGGKATLKETEAPGRALLDRGLFGVGPGFRRDNDFGVVGAKNSISCGATRRTNSPAFGTG
jgi:hypothetical protein